MSSLYRKDPVVCEVNGKKVTIRPLGIGIVLSLKEIRKPVADAIAKFTKVNVSDYKQTLHSTPKPTKDDPDAFEYIDRTEHSAPSPVAVTQVVNNKSQAIEALFNCLLEERIIAKVFTSSVKEFKGMNHEQLFSDEDNAMDLPTAVEYLGHIIDVNTEGFKNLGKSFSPLKKFVAAFKELGKKTTK